MFCSTSTNKMEKKNLLLFILNCTTKTVFNLKYHLDKYFQEIIYRIDNWINEGSGWVIESINGEYVNRFIYKP